MRAFILLIFISLFILDAHSATEVPDLESFLSGMFLETPLIRRAPSGDLILGEGHIDPSKHDALPPEFKAGGRQELTSSMVDGSLDFHRNDDFSTASAEGNKAFNSDWVGNLTNPSHRDTLFTPKAFDLVFDATYVPDIYSEGFLAKVAGSLNPGGTFIMQLPITLEEGTYRTGHSGGKDNSMDWFNEKLSFPTLEEVYDYWQDTLKTLGFSEVTCHESPMMELIRAHLPVTDPYDTKSIDMDSFEAFMETPAGKEAIAKSQQSSPVAKLHLHLAHFLLSTNYIIARV